MRRRTGRSLADPCPAAPNRSGDGAPAPVHGSLGSPSQVDSACGVAVRALAVGRLLISADSHVMEPLDLWTSGLPGHLRAHGPRVEPREGVACLLVEDTVVRRLPVLAKAPGPADAPDEKTFAPGASDPAGRLRG